jgi:hypothetical protein
VWGYKQNTGTGPLRKTMGRYNAQKQKKIARDQSKNKSKNMARPINDKHHFFQSIFFQTLRKVLFEDVRTTHFLFSEMVTPNQNMKVFEFWIFFKSEKSPTGRRQNYLFYFLKC